MLALTCYVLASAMFVVTLYWTERRDTQHWGGNEPPQCRRRQQGLAVTDRRQHPVPDFRDHSLEIVIPAKAGIQYAAAHRLNHQPSGILDRPPSRAMTRSVTLWPDCIRAAARSNVRSNRELHRVARMSVSDMQVCSGVPDVAALIRATQRAASSSRMSVKKRGIA